MPKPVELNQRRAEFVDAAWRIIRKEGFRAATLRRVAAEARCTTGALTHYFNNREALLLDAIRSAHAAAAGRMLVTARAAASGLRIPQPMACFLIAEAARGLDYAHERTDASGHSLGIVHRDVSPPNILLSTAGDVKIADFGISKAIGKLHKTATGAVMGKFRYMSPEQVAGLALDRRSDVFALGVILWELLTGHALFSGESATRVAECVQKADVPAPSLKNPEVPPELDRNGRGICGVIVVWTRDPRRPPA